MNKITIKKIVFIVFSFFISFFLLLFFLFVIVSVFLPDVSNLEYFDFPSSSHIYDREGNLLYTLYDTENRDWVAIDEVSENLINATVAIEDDAFWEHLGFDLGGIYKALSNEVFDGELSRGGSTITQQLVKNVFLSSERTWSRKFKEIVLSINMEFFYSKEEILEFYLNKIPYGNNAFGVSNAARLYFDKDVRFLTIAESAVLAALPQAPSRYNPYGLNKYPSLNDSVFEDLKQGRVILSESDLDRLEFNRGLFSADLSLDFSQIDIEEGENFDEIEQEELEENLVREGRLGISDEDLLDEENLVREGRLGIEEDFERGNTVRIKGRSELIVDRMFELSMITKEEHDQAVKDLEIMELEKYVEAIKYPHFVFFILSELEENFSEDVLRRGGLEIYTSIDPDVQDYVQDLADEKRSYYNYKFAADNMAIMVADAHNGEILAMLGSYDYFDEEIDGQVNVATSLRQPGSSFKPFIYAKAFMEGFSPWHFVDDAAMKIGNNWPQNYDGKFNGQMTMREALIQSRNIPAIKAYFLAGEQEKIVPFLQNLAFPSIDENWDYGYPLALGAAEVSLYDMVQGYQVLANSGVKNKLEGILRIEDYMGNPIYEREENNGKEVLDPAIAYLISDVLSDSSLALGSYLKFSEDVASKTGTSTKASKKGSSYVRPADLWTLGYSPSYVVGVWVANTDGSGLAYSANGYSAAGPVYSSIMRYLLKDSDRELFAIPEFIEKIWVYYDVGMINGYREESFASEYFLAENVNYKKTVEQGFSWPSSIILYKPKKEDEKKKSSLESGNLELIKVDGDKSDNDLGGDLPVVPVQQVIEIPVLTGSPLNVPTI